MELSEGSSPEYRGAAQKVSALIKLATLMLKHMAKLP